MSNITPQSAQARIGQRTWASVSEQVKPARMIPTSPPSCKCTTRCYAFGRLRAARSSSAWTQRCRVVKLRAGIPRHPGSRLAQRGQDLTPSWRARPLQRSRTQLQLHGSVQLQCVVHPTGCGDAAPTTIRARAVWLDQRLRIHSGHWASFAPTRPAPGDHPLAHSTPPATPSSNMLGAGHGCRCATPTTMRAHGRLMRHTPTTRGGYPR